MCVGPVYNTQASTSHYTAVSNPPPQVYCSFSFSLDQRIQLELEWRACGTRPSAPSASEGWISAKPDAASELEPPESEPSDEVRDDVRIRASVRLVTVNPDSSVAYDKVRELLEEDTPIAPEGTEGMGGRSKPRAVAVDEDSDEVPGVTGKGEVDELETEREPGADPGLPALLNEFPAAYTAPRAEGMYRVARLETRPNACWAYAGVPGAPGAPGAPPTPAPAPDWKPAPGRPAPMPG